MKRVLTAAAGGVLGAAGAISAAGLFAAAPASAAPACAPDFACDVIQDQPPAFVESIVDSANSAVEIVTGQQLAEQVDHRLPAEHQPCHAGQQSRPR